MVDDKSVSYMDPDNNKNAQKNSDRHSDIGSTPFLSEILNKFERFNQLLSDWLAWFGVIAVLALLLLTCVDVIGGNFFQLPVPGFDEAIGLGQLMAMSFAAAITLNLNRHVRVDLFIRRLPMRLQAAINSLTNLLGLSLFVLITWRFFLFGRTLQISGEISEAWGLPLYPFVFLATIAFVPVCLSLLWQFISSIVKVVKT
jgi:TRAP-type mannitol/chloroaromatic compound transport system permease small subunit